MVFATHTQWLQGALGHLAANRNAAGDCICMCKHDNIHNAHTLSVVSCHINISRLNSLMWVINRAAFRLIYSKFYITVLLIIGKILYKGMLISDLCNMI